MSTFGHFYRVTTFGESHGGSVGCILDGVPSQISLREEDIQPQLSRRRPGQSALTTPRQEEDKVTIHSGTEHGITLGTPLSASVPNRDMRPQDYAKTESIPRPSHADYTYQLKYGIHASSGGGRSSARETIGRVIAGAVAEKVLSVLSPHTMIVAFVSAVGHVRCPDEGAIISNQDFLTRDNVDKTPVRCPDPLVSIDMAQEITSAAQDGDSVGGVITCVIRNPPAGLGEPCFDKLEAMLAHAMLSIPATKGFEIGSGFRGATMRGSQHNDMFVKAESSSLSGGLLRTTKNDSGGVQGGITNGEDIVFRVAFKPPATISIPQQTCSLTGEPRVLEASGRHDPCVVPRAVPIVEAMAAVVLLDALLIQRGKKM